MLEKPPCLFSGHNFLATDRSQMSLLKLLFYGCENSFEDYSGAAQREPVVEDQLKEQLLLGIENGPMQRALKTYARHHAEGTFAELHQEALLLEVEYGHGRYETACAAISQLDTPNPRSYRPDWKAELKREILEEVKGQIQELTGSGQRVEDF